MIAITLQQILDADPCYDPITKHGLKGVDRNAPISFRKIVEVAGVIHLMTDPRSLAALEVARRHAKGQASNEELAVAQRTAEAAEAAEAAWTAAKAAEAAARAAEINWQGRRLIDLTEAGVWTPVEEADKRGWSSYGH